MSDFDWMDAIEDPILKRTIWETGSIAITDKEAAESFVDEAIEQNPKVVELYRAGKKQSLGKLIGWVMKKSDGCIEPASMIVSILEERLA
jgi:aspartyl-tRNA(Asn)/glutamyl-tRNA(Gln) amidotransferase subunit B